MGGGTDIFCIEGVSFSLSLLLARSLADNQQFQQVMHDGMLPFSLKRAEIPLRGWGSCGAELDGTELGGQCLVGGAATVVCGVRASFLRVRVHLDPNPKPCPATLT